jgi:regulator of protease activity HflC (stomatin/prohibitin superfamily)
MRKPWELAERGINLVDSIGNWMQTQGLKTGFVPLGWDHDLRPGLVWRIPDQGVRSAVTLAKVQGVLVREYEQAIVLHNGTFYAELPPGVYSIQKMPVKDYVDVIWVSTQITRHKWGVGRVLNVEDITIGAHGYIMIRIADVRKFVLGVVAGSRKYSQQDLEDWVFGIVSGIMRTQIAVTTIRDLMQSQEGFARACSNRLAEAFNEWGISFENLVVNQFDIPQEYRDIVARVTLSKYQRDTTIIEAEAEAEALRLRSEAEAAARLTTGGAEVEILARMQAFGLDPVRLKTIEALAQYAELAAQAGGGGGDSDMAKMMMLMLMSRLLNDPGMPAQAKQYLQTQFPMETMRAEQLPAPASNPDVQAGDDVSEEEPGEELEVPQPKPEDVSEDERARIGQVLDNLDERLAAGEISESTYERLYAKWERRLEAL